MGDLVVWGTINCNTNASFGRDGFGKETGQAQSWLRYRPPKVSSLWCPPKGISLRYFCFYCMPLYLKQDYQGKLPILPSPPVARGKE